MVNILFCVLRNADPHIENIPTGENVNMVLHEYQEKQKLQLLSCNGICYNE